MKRSLCFSLSVSDQVSYPKKATDQITVLYILVFYIWIAKWKKKDTAAHDRNSPSLQSLSRLTPNAEKITGNNQREFRGTKSTAGNIFNI